MLITIPKDQEQLVEIKEQSDLRILNEKQIANKAAKPVRS